MPSGRGYPGGMGWQFGRQAVLRGLELRGHHLGKRALWRRLGGALRVVDICKDSDMLSTSKAISAFDLHALRKVSLASSLGFCGYQFRVADGEGKQRELVVVSRQK